jgi:hypothetical protein
MKKMAETSNLILSIFINQVDFERVHLKPKYGHFVMLYPLLLLFTGLSSAVHGDQRQEK